MNGLMTQVYWCMGIIATAGILGYLMPIRENGKWRKQTESERNGWLSLIRLLAVLVTLVSVCIINSR